MGDLIPILITVVSKADQGYVLASQAFTGQNRALGDQVKWHKKLQEAEHSCDLRPAVHRRANWSLIGRSPHRGASDKNRRSAGPWTAPNKTVFYRHAWHYWVSSGPEDCPGPFTSMRSESPNGPHAASSLWGSWQPLIFQIMGDYGVFFMLRSPPSYHCWTGTGPLLNGRMLAEGN